MSRNCLRGCLVGLSCVIVGLIGLAGVVFSVVTAQDLAESLTNNALAHALLFGWFWILLMAMAMLAILLMVACVALFIEVVLLMLEVLKLVFQD